MKVRQRSKTNGKEPNGIGTENYTLSKDYRSLSFGFVEFNELICNPVRI